MLNQFIAQQITSEAPLLTAVWCVLHNCGASTKGLVVHASASPTTTILSNVSVRSHQLLMP